MKLPHCAKRAFRAHGALWLSAGFIALSLSGCGGAPYVDTRREAGQTQPVGASTPDMVAICYSSQSTTPGELLSMAESECAKTDRTARFSHQETASCSLMTPTHAYFRCVTKP